MNKSFSFSCFCNTCSYEHDVEISMDDLYAIVQRGKKVINRSCGDLKSLTEQARNALSAGDKSTYDKLKKSSLPAITPHAFFPGRRLKDAEYTVSGIMMLDFDHIDGLETLIDKAKEIACVVMACKSLSGEGVHLLVKYKPVRKQDFSSAYQSCMDYFEYALGVKADSACKDITRLMIINYDPGVFYNLDAIALDLTGDLWLKQNDYSMFNIDNEMTERERISRYLAEADSNLNWGRGNRHNTLVSLATRCNQNGFDKELVKEWVCSKHAEPDFDDREINETVDDVYARYASDHGIKQKESSAKMDKRTNGHNSPNIHKESEEEDWDEEELLNEPCPDAEALRPYIMNEVFDYVVDPMDSTEVRFVSAIGMLTACGAMMKHVGCVYRGREIHPHIFMNVIGEPGSGKGCINKPRGIFKIYADDIENASEAEQKKMENERKAWKKCVEDCKSGDCGCGPEPEVTKVVRPAVSLNISQNKLIEQLAINKTTPTMLSDTEMDFKLNLKEMSLSTALRALFENESVGSHTLSRGDTSVSHPKGSVLVAGTPAQAQRFFDNKEDGLVSRFVTFFLPKSPYRPLESYYSTVGDYDNRKEAIEGRVLTFSGYASTHKFRLHLSQEDVRLLDAFFTSAEQRYAKFYGSAVGSFIRRLQDIDVRMAMVLTVFGLFKGDKTEGSYDIPAEIIRLVVGWNDYLIQQNIRLSSLLPDPKSADGGKELKYAHIYDKLSCEFKLKDAKKPFESLAGVCKRTAQRVLDTWIQAGLLERRSGTYYKVGCREKESLSKGEHNSPC